MITYKGFELGPDSDLYDEDFYVAAEVDEVIKELWSDIAVLKEMLREAATLNSRKLDLRYDGTMNVKFEQ